MALTTLPSAGSKLRASVLAALMAERMPLFARKAANETIISNATLQDDDDLGLPVEASCTYKMELRASFNSGVTPDFKIGWTYPALTTIRWAGVDLDLTGAIRITGNLLETTVVTLSGGGDFTIFYTGVVVTGANAGTLRWQWAQNTLTASNTTVYAGSYLMLQRVE